MYYSHEKFGLRYPFVHRVAFLIVQGLYVDKNLFIVYFEAQKYIEYAYIHLLKNQ